MEKEKALELLKEHLHNKNLVKHCIAVGAITKELAQYFDEDEEIWETAGLLHDIDYEQTKDNHEKHGLVSVEILDGRVCDEVLDTIPRHNKLTGKEPKKKIDFALTAGDAISGLLVATALVHPNKLDDVEVSSVKKKFDDSSFAKNVDRDRILLCEKIDLSLDEFIEISLRAVKKVKEELGL